MTPPQKKKPSGTTSAKQATKGAKPAPRKRAKAPTKDTAKAAPKGGAKPKASATKKTATKRTTKKSAPKPAPAQSAVADLEQCAALTTKGTRCRLKPSDGTIFCARHQDATTVAPEAAPFVQPQKNGKVDAVPTPAKAAEGPAAVEEGPTPTAAAKGRAKPIARRPKKEESPVESESPSVASAEASEDSSDAVPDEDEEFVLYASEYSTTLEASPYDDQISKQVAEGEEDVDLVEEHQMGRGSRGPRHQRAQPRHQDQRQQEQRPRMTQEEAEAKALEKLGPRPEIAPEEDLDEVLVAYDRKFKSEVNHLMGRKRRKRGRRGGRRRGQDGGDGRGGGGGGGQGGGHRGGGGGRGGGRRGGKRRGRGGGQGGGGSGGDGGSSGGGGARRGPPKNVARDSPLANNRPSRGPKRAVQPRRRREPDV